MTMYNKTCGELFREAFEKMPESHTRFETFTFGFVVGQAEKVYLEACPAFMTKAAPDEEEYLVKALDVVAHHYDLWHRRLETPDGIEHWLLGTASYRMFNTLVRLEHHSPEYHLVRATLCGIPSSRVDFKFHERYNTSLD